MLRMQLYIPEDIHQWLLYIKKARGVSMGKFVRENLRKIKYQEEKEGNNLLDLAKHAVKGGDPNLSKNYKEYLYGKWRGKK